MPEKYFGRGYHGFTRFHGKSGSVSFFHLSMCNFVQKIKKILRAVLEKNDHLPNQLTNNTSWSSTDVENCNVVKRLAQRQSKNIRNFPSVRGNKSTLSTMCVTWFVLVFVCVYVCVCRESRTLVEA